MEAKKRPISKTLACSLVVFSFTLCFVTLIHVEIELHAHRNMLQVLTLQSEEGIHSRRTVNDKLIASALRSDNGKGQWFFYCSQIFGKIRIVPFARNLSFVTMSYFVTWETKPLFIDSERNWKGQFPNCILSEKAFCRIGFSCCDIKGLRNNLRKCLNMSRRFNSSVQSVLKK